MSTLALVWPQPFQTFQRDGSNSADLAIQVTVGAYNPADGALEAQWCGGTFKTIVATPATGTNIGTLTGQVCVPFTPSLCQGTLTVRFINNHAVSASAATVGIGDTCGGLGDSRPAGTGTNGQVYTNAAGLKATRWNFNTAQWQDANSPAEGGGAGSIFPLIATLHMLDQGVPFGYLNAGHTGTDVIGDTSWSKTGTATAYNHFVTWSADSHVNRWGFLSNYLGPNASTIGGYTVAQVKTALSTLLSNLHADVPAAAASPMYVDSHGPCSAAVNRAALDNYRNAVQQLANEGTIFPGPIEEEQNYDIHWVSDADILWVARRSWLAFKRSSFSGTNKRGPRPAALSINGPRTVLTLTFDQVLSNAALAAMTASAWRTYDGATPSTPTSVVVTGDQMGVTITAAAPIVGTPSIDYASGDDAKAATVPLSVAWSLPDGNSITLPLEPIYGLVIFNSPSVSPSPSSSASASQSPSASVSPSPSSSASASLSPSASPSASPSRSPSASASASQSPSSSTSPSQSPSSSASPSPSIGNSSSPSASASRSQSPSASPSASRSPSSSASRSPSPSIAGPLATPDVTVIC